MGQPILLEGEPGVGKTEAAKALATVLDTPLVRLQCYEGLDRGRGALRVELPAPAARHPAGRGTWRRAARRGSVQRRTTCWPGRCSPRSSIRGPRPAVLLIDEVDRADDEFEAFLFEMLAEASVTIPELGTRRAATPPIVVLTSNRTRDLHDALRRRCLYHWIDYPNASRVAEIIRAACRPHRTIWLAGRERR